MKDEAHTGAETGTLSVLRNVTMSLPQSGEIARQNLLELVCKREDTSVEKLFFATLKALQFEAVRY